MSSQTPLRINQEDVTKRLQELKELTGYDIVQNHGQRIYGGPPPGWTGLPPDKGTEIYCYRIPRDCFEDELVPVFSEVGRIYELRLMIEFSGTNRSYCYVRYMNQEDAREAIRKLHNFPIRPGCLLAVTRSVDNRKLCIKIYPPLDKEVKEMVAVEELNNVVEGVANVKYLAGGWAEVEFNTHRLAALARRDLVPGNVLLFSKFSIKQVDWSDPEDSGKASQGKVLAVKNVPSSTSCRRVEDVFNKVSGCTVSNVAWEKDRVLISFISQEGASLAMDNSSNVEIDGSRLDVSWWNNKRLDRGGSNVLQQEPISVPVPQVPGPVEQLHQIAVTQGWGAPQYSLTGSRYNVVAGLQIYQCTVTFPAVTHRQVIGDWAADRRLARISAATKAIWVTVKSRQMLHIQPFQAPRNYQMQKCGLIDAGGYMGQVSGPHPSQLAPSLLVPGPVGISQFSRPPPFTSCQPPNHAISLHPIVKTNQPPPPPGFLPISLPQYRPPISSTVSTTQMRPQAVSTKPVLAVPPNHRSSIQTSLFGNQQGGTGQGLGEGTSSGGGGVRITETGHENSLLQYYGVDYNNNYYGRGSE